MNISTEKLTALRKERGWSQEKLAALSGISERTIQRVERDGTCSLETKMALASAFEISPLELHAEAEPVIATNLVQITSWSGALGLLILGLAAPFILLLTATDGKWELICLSLVWGLTIVLSMMIYGTKATYKLFDHTSWIVKYPSHVPNLSNYIIHAKSIIEYSYIIGFVSSLVCALTIAVHVPSETKDIPNYLTYIIRPFIYSIVFSELWFRPFKRRMEHMLLTQNHQET